VTGYPASHDGFVSGQAYIRDAVTATRFQAVSLPAPAGPAEGEFALIVNRTLFHSLEGAAIHSPEADKLHREEFVEIHPTDADRLQLKSGDEVSLANGSASVSIRAFVTENVQPGTLLVPLLYDGGAVTALFPSGGGEGTQRVSLRVAVTS
jgi:anaerobic selenocysteine-containing dehydrogenase